jgi:cardiolipin synthase
MSQSRDERPEATAPPAARPSSAVVTVPNAISLARLLLMPVCAWLLGTGHYASGLVLTAVVGATDWVDGWLARRIGQVSRVGQLLDPFADRMLIASVAIALLIRDVLPWPAVALLIGRDLILLAGWPLLWLGVALYYVAGVVYVRMAIAGLSRRASAGT